MRFPCRSTIAALVIVSMALSSVAPRTYAHAHEPVACHDHEHSHSHFHTHSHGAHCHTHSHASSTESSQAAMFASLSHQHVVWWGVEFLLVASPNSDSHLTTEDGDAEQWIGTSPAAQKTIVSANSPLALIATFEPLAIQVVVAAPRRDFRPPRVERNLLCDTARHARTGVQLA